MSEQKQTTPDNKVTLHHVGDERVDRLRIFAYYGPLARNAHREYAIVDAKRDEAIQTFTFQSGPVCEEGVNGVTNEALLGIVAHRLQAYQSGPMACRENAIALMKIEHALEWLHGRTRRRLAAGVEGRGKP